MIPVILKRASARKLRLIACSMAQRVQHYLNDDRTRDLLNVMEQHAHRFLADDAYQRSVASTRYLSYMSARQEPSAPYDRVAHLISVLHDALLLDNPAACLERTYGIVLSIYLHVKLQYQRNEQEIPESIFDLNRVIAEQIRELIGPLDHPLVLMPEPMLQGYGGHAARLRACRGGSVLPMARAILKDQTFAQLPVLADALQENGLEDAVLLQHLRENTSHGRGCWALDLVLGRG
jgi:hypothetical protein